MHRLVSVLDTNIFISSVFWEGYPYRVVQKALDNEIIVFISKEIINEIKRVLARDFNLTNHEIDNIIDVSETYRLSNDQRTKSAFPTGLQYVSEHVKNRSTNEGASTLCFPRRGRFLTQ